MKQLIITVIVAATLTACGGSSSDNPLQTLNDGNPVTVSITPNATPAISQPVTQVAGSCVDDNGDGYGWNGVASCQVVTQTTQQPVTIPVTPAPVETVPVITQPDPVQTESVEPEQIQVTGSVYQCQIRTTVFSRVFSVTENGTRSVSESSGNIMGVWNLEGDQLSLNLSSGNAQYTISGTQLISTSGETELASFPRVTGEHEDAARNQTFRFTNVRPRPGAACEERVPGGTLHADWIAGWNDEVQKLWLENCTHDGVNCSIGQTGTNLALNNNPQHYDTGHLQNTDWGEQGSYMIHVPTGSMHPDSTMPMACM